MIYLDCNATTPLDPEVSRAIAMSLSKFGNPSSSHTIGRQARAAIEEARSSVARLIGAEPEEIIFTSGGTEANNLAIMGTAAVFGKGRIITSLIEHPSVINPVRYLEQTGFTATYLGVDKHCRVSPDELRAAIRKDTVLITLMHSNNETGILQPIKECLSIAKEHGIAFHTDCAQSAGKVPISASMADMITIAPHKFYGPKGTGALYVNKSMRIKPILFGAGHEGGMRPGTENTPGIVGFGKACEVAERDMKKRIEISRNLRDMLYARLKSGLGSRMRLNGHSRLRLPNTLNIRISGVDALAVVGSLGKRLAISTGSACHAGVNTPSRVLKAMGLGDADALSSFRFCVGKDNTEEEIEGAVKIFLAALRPYLRAR